MGSFGKYKNPPPVGRALANTLNQMIPADGEDQYQGNDGMVDPYMMGGGLPSPDFYGQPKQQWNAEMMDRLIDTSIEERVDDEGHLLPKPQLWLFETSAFRHFQLSNLRSRDQTEIERDIADIYMLSRQDGNESLCDEAQTKVYAKIAMFKSRSDLPIQHRERDAWFTNVSEMKTHEIRRPQGSNGFFADFTGKKRRSDY